MSDIYCPYCLVPTDVRKVLYRCLRDQPECAAPFLAGRQNPQAICPGCGIVAHRRVCPNLGCQHDLPAGYCSSYRNLIIPIFGALNSGKSTYLAVLIHEMQSRVARELNATFTHRDDQTKNQYANLMARPLFQEGLVLPATTAGEGLTPTSPLVYRLRYDSKKAQSVNLVFFDAAGEDMAEEHQRDRYEPYLKAADGIIFIIDPAEFPGSGGDLARSKITEAAGGVSAGEHTVLQLTQFLQEMRPGPKRKVRIPACLVLSKIDALPTTLSTEHGDRFATAIHRRSGRRGQGGCARRSICPARPMAVQPGTGNGGRVRAFRPLCNIRPWRTAARGSSGSDGRAPSSSDRSPGLAARRTRCRSEMLSATWPISCSTRRQVMD